VQVMAVGCRVVAARARVPPALGCGAKGTGGVRYVVLTPLYVISRSQAAGARAYQLRERQAEAA
jgi:hypothetical protein